MVAVRVVEDLLDQPATGFLGDHEERRAAGVRAQLDAATETARARRVKVMKLPIAGAFHSPSMREAVPVFREVLDRTEFASPSVPVFSCTTAKPFNDIRATLFLEPGPGKVLTGLVRRTLPEAEAVALEAA